MKFVRLKHRRGVRVRTLRTVYMDVVKEEKRDRQESRAVRNRCVEGYHWLNLLASGLISQTLRELLFYPSSEFTPPRVHAGHCSEQLPFPPFSPAVLAGLSRPYSSAFPQTMNTASSFPPKDATHVPASIPPHPLTCCPVWSAFFFLLCFSSSYHPLQFFLDSFIPLWTHWANLRQVTLDLPTDETVSSCMLLSCFSLRKAGW